MSDPPNTDPPRDDARAREHRTSKADGEPRESGEVRAFFELLGNLLRRPPKQIEPLQSLVAEVLAPEAEPSGAAPAWPADAAVRPAPARRRQTALVIVFCAVAAGAVLIRELQPKVVTTLPSNLVGVWRTGAPSYADRRLEITRSQLGFQGGAGVAPAPLHPIVRVRQSAESEGVLFRVEYLQEDTRAELDFVWIGSRPPQIRFSHQSDFVWSREEPAGSPAPPGRPAR